MRRLGSVPTGRLTLDGRSLAKRDGEALRAGRRRATNGSALISLVLGRDGSLLADPQISVRGLAEEIEEGRLQDQMAAAVERAVVGLSGNRRHDDDAVRDAARSALRLPLRNRYAQRPIIPAHLLRLGHRAAPAQGGDP